MRVPVFVSCPTRLDQDQQKSYEVIVEELRALNMEPRALGRSDFGTRFPLREVESIARFCAGGVILGFRQRELADHDGKTVYLPTPWNNLEAGILYALGKPLIVFREGGIEGGIFDLGVTDLFIQQMPTSQSGSLREVTTKWSADVLKSFYSK